MLENTSNGRDEIDFQPERDSAPNAAGGTIELVRLQNADAESWGLQVELYVIDDSGGHCQGKLPV